MRERVTSRSRKEDVARRTSGRARHRRRRASRAVAVTLGIAGALVLPSLLVGATTQTANVTIVAQDLDGNPISNFTFLVSEDNAGRRTDPPSQRPGRKPTPSYIPLVAAGDQSSATVSLDSPGRYVVTVKAPGHKLWGKHFSLPGGAGQQVVQLEKFPLKLGKLVIHAFHDRRPVNAAPDFIGEENGEPGLQGFEVRLHDTVGELQADYNGDPLCGGVCLTNADGNVTIPNLAPGRYEIEVLPPDGTDWLQTTTFEGTHLIDFGRVTENDDGLGALDEARVAAGVRTAWWFGFVQPMDLPATCSPCGSISGTAKTWVGWPYYNEIFFGEPVPSPIVALSDIGGSEAQVFTGFGDPDGSFAIGNIPDGTYTLSILDENLDWIIRYVTFTLPDPVTGSRVLDLNVEDVKGELGVPVARWFGRASGYVFEDNGLDAVGGAIPGGAANNGIRDCDPSNPDRCEEGIDGVDLDLRWRDGSVKSATFTGPHPETQTPGYYEYPELLSPLSKFLISEVGFGRFARTGMSLHDEFDASSVSPLPTGLGGGLLLNQLTLEGHRSWVDWGKREYALDDPTTPAYDGEHGGITGIVFYATTRNEFNPALAAAEDYEPAIPNATVKLWGPGPDLEPNTPDDVLVNEVTTDAWSHPRSDNPDEPQSCDVRDALGATLPPFNPDIAPNCLEFPALSNETKDGAFDGGYAIETMLNDPITGAPTPSEPLLTPGNYVVEVVPPPFYQVIKEEDQNTDEGDVLVPQVPPPPCVGPPHLVTDPRNPANGEQKPLCNKKLVALDDGQNPAADFFLFTDVDDDPATNTAADGSWNTVESVAPPGRIFGFVGDDLRFDTDETSPWFGQPLALPNIPVGVYDYNGRRITMLHTDEHGFYDVVLPSTQTYNCPTPSGVCPGMYVLRIDDPADPAFNPDYLTAALAFDVWPGKTTYADTPVDPISAVVCNLGVLPDPGPGESPGFEFPEFWRVDPNPYIQRTGTDAQRELTLNGTGFGATRGSQGRVTIGGVALPTSAYLDWGNRVIRIRVPSAFVSAGPRQLLIRAANGQTTPVGITIHVLGGTYTPPIVHVPEDQPTVQAAIDASSDNGLVVVHRGSYNESVIMHRRVKLQGVGPGGSVGAPENSAIDDIRFTVPGSVINGRNFFEREAAWNAKLASLPKPAGYGDVTAGADITVVPRTTAQFGTGRNAAIDGLGLIFGQGGGAGGIQVNAFARSLEITDNVIESNGGEYGGAIALGLPSLYNVPAGQLLNANRLDNQNDDVRIAFNRILGNGGRRLAGGVAIYNGAERYVVEQNDICGNYSNEYGGGISHFGRSGGQSPTGGARGRILDNRIFGNDAFDSGGGIMIAGEYPPGIEQEARGSGRVDVEQNFISLNLSNDDGGGIMLLDTMGTAGTAVSLVGVGSNMITNNAATDIGGGMTIDDAHNVQVINNTFARNASTDTSEDRNFLPNGAGFVSEKNTLNAGFSVPVAFFNNIFWNNEAFTFDPNDPDDGLVSAGMIDLEVYGTPGTLSPRYSILTDGANTDDHPSNIVGADPAFALVYDMFIFAGPARVTGEFQTTLVREDPPVPGGEGMPGNYHITPGSPALCAGVGTLDGVPRWSPDIDGQVRATGNAPPAVRPEIGADEVPGGAGC